MCFRVWAMMLLFRERALFHKINVSIASQTQVPYLLSQPTCRGSFSNKPMALIPLTEEMWTGRPAPCHTQFSQCASNLVPYIT
jgi:hypothetical protein